MFFVLRQQKNKIPESGIYQYLSVTFLVIICIYIPKVILYLRRKSEEIQYGFIPDINIESGLFLQLVNFCNFVRA